jgi:hypothetical protein
MLNRAFCVLHPPAWARTDQLLALGRRRLLLPADVLAEADLVAFAVGQGEVAHAI